MKQNVEILSPAGSYESMKAAISAGADAVYIGGTRFGARAYADNLQEEAMLEAIDYVHLHGRKIYLTVNTLLKEQEIEELYDYLLPYYKQGIDAVIVQDIGVLQFVKEQFPNLPIHASTQMTITNVLGAKFLEKLGVERVVTAREMQLDEIKEIAEQTNLEIESFVHGALCYCYSGQCLYSSLLGGRSGNRGQCAQPCRLPYRMQGTESEQYLMSLKDICTLNCIPELIESGIHSFKIEGRMKRPEYVALVTAMYRKYVDLYFQAGKAHFHVDEKDKEMLMDLYNRGGFHEGYYHTKNGREMVSLERPNHAGVPALKVISQKGKTLLVKALVDIHKGDVIELSEDRETFTFAFDVQCGKETQIVTHKRQAFHKNQLLIRTRNEKLLTDIQRTFLDEKVKEVVNGKLILTEDECASLQLSLGEIVVQTEGEVVQKAVNQPVSAERIEKQMRKTGNTEFELEDLEIDIKGSVFLPMQSINELRRAGLEELKSKILSTYRRESEQRVCPKEMAVFENSKKPSFYVYVEQKEQLEEVLNHSFVRRIYMDCNLMHRVWMNEEIHAVIREVHDNGKEIYLAMPHIFRKQAVANYEKSYEFLFGADWDGVLVRNYESYEFLRTHNYQKSIVTDYNLYQFNRYAKNFWCSEKVEGTTAPIELNYKELKSIGQENSELIVYGHMPMMVSAQCIAKTVKECKKEKQILNFIDRYRKVFSVKNLCDYCYNIIYNTLPTVLTDQKDDILDLNPQALRMHFTVENQALVHNMLELYESIFEGSKNPCEPDIAFTRGHFRRGIK